MQWITLQDNNDCTNISVYVLPPLIKQNIINPNSMLTFQPSSFLPY